YMELGGALAYAQPRPDLLVLQAPREEAHHVQFALREPRSGTTTRPAALPDLLEKLGGHDGLEQRAPGVHHPHRVENLLPSGPFEEVALRPRPPRVQYPLVGIESGEPPGPRPRLLLPQPPDGPRPVQAGHLQVEQYHIRLQSLREVHRLQPCSR